MMNTAILFFLVFVVPPVLAYKLARRWGRSGWKWAVICFCTHYIGLILLILLPSRATPTLLEYREKHPECATNNGTACAYCGSHSIRLWREQ